MAWMVAVLPQLKTVATILTAVGAVKQGRAMDKIGKAKASQLRTKAGQERAVGQHKAINRRRETDLAESRTLALAAASGAGASDPTIMNLIANLAGEGERNYQAAMYEGEEKARGLEYQADVSIYEGQVAKQKGYLTAGAAILSSASDSLHDKYSPVEGDAYMPAYPHQAGY